MMLESSLCPSPSGLCCAVFALVFPTRGSVVEREEPELWSRRDCVASYSFCLEADCPGVNYFTSLSPSVLIY